MGLDAVVLGADSAVLDSHLHHLGGTGVQLTGGSTTTLVRGNSLVRNCDIHDFAQVNQVYTLTLTLNLNLTLTLTITITITLTLTLS